MNSQYEMDVLKAIVSDTMKVEIIKRSNKQEAVGARKIFSKILSERGYTRTEIGHYLKKDQASICYYMNDVDHMIKAVPRMDEVYKHCKESLLNVVGETINVDNKTIVSLKVRIDELLLDRESMKEKLNHYERIKQLIDLVDCHTPIGEESSVLKKMRIMFNEMRDYGGDLE
jgi:predicted transcriptional regulator